MVLATVSLVAGARLLDTATLPAALGFLAIAVGIALAATSIAAAWRPASSRGPDADSTVP
jgi:hypothetical protein